MTKTMWLSVMFSGVLLMSVPARAATPLSVLSDAVPAAEAPQVKDDLFAGTEKFAQGASDVSEVNLDKNMLGMVNHKGKDGELAGKMDFIVVHSYTYDKPGMYKMEDVEVFRKKLTDGSWSCFVHTRDKDGTTDICSRSDDRGESNELVVMTAEAKELTFVHMKGRLSLGDLSKMGNGMGGGRKSMPAPPAPPSMPSKPVGPAPPAPGV